jgi:hypothetical protein
MNIISDIGTRSDVFANTLLQAFYVLGNHRSGCPSLGHEPHPGERSQDAIESRLLSRLGHPVGTDNVPSNLTQASRLHVSRKGVPTMREPFAEYSTKRLSKKLYVLHAGVCPPAQMLESHEVTLRPL